MPDIKDREEILGIHAKGKPLASEVNVRTIAERTPGFSGADLSNLMNEAAILAVRRGKSEITMDEILSSIEKVLLGPERKSRVISEYDKKVTAYHEAGHAIVGYLMPYSDPVRKVSIISRGSAGGYTLKMPSEDKHYHTLAQFKDELAMALGGYVVEKMIFGAEFVSTGPSSDLRTATKLARDMVTRYGMSSTLGARTFGEHEELVFLGREIHEERDYSDRTAQEIDTEIKGLITEAEQRAKTIIEANKEKLEKFVAALLQKETIEQAEIEALMGVPQTKKVGRDA
jgi:cell division protease FtsH